MVKEDGGLGFKKLREFNIAMLAKQAWRLVNNVNPLVTRLMKARYFPQSNFLQAKLGVNPNYVWRSILASQEVLKQGCRRRIGDGKSIRVWEMPWLLCVDNGYFTSEKHEELEHIEVQALFDESQQCWDDDILRDLCNERDRKMIQRIPIPLRQKDDTWFWLLESKGNFTVKSCYRRLRGEFECRDKEFWSKVWRL